MTFIHSDKNFCSDEIGILIINRDNKKILDINQNITDIFGCRHNEIVGKNVEEMNYLLPGEKEKLSRNFMLSGEFSGFRSKITKKSGDYEEVIISGKDFPAFNLIIVIILNITADEKMISAMIVKKSQNRILKSLK